MAIKVLPDEFAKDDQRLRRFQREAKVLASLNHPNIAAIYGLEQSDDTHYLVLELVAGETLAARIARGPIPVAEALQIAIKVAEAVEEAHEHGIVHRDLKPANIMLTSDGKVKVLDFGLAKAFVEEIPDADDSMSPTLTRDATRMGVILGTAAYMSPEQAKGKEVDKRTDIWAFGAVLFEMLSGRRAFAGEDVSETLAFVLTKELGWQWLPATTPATVTHLMRRCLERDQKRRLRDIGEARVAIEDYHREPATSRAVARPSRRWLAPMLAAVIGAVVATLMPSSHESDGEASLRLTNIRRLTTTPGAETQPTLAPDGDFVAFVSSSAGNRDIWVQNLSGGAPAQLTRHPSDDFDPAWSPDGNDIVFRSARSGGGLFVVAAFGGDVTRISSMGYRPKWSRDSKKILFHTRVGGQVPNEVYVMDYPPRGEPVRLLEWSRGKDPFVYASWSPDGSLVSYRTGHYVAGSGIAVRSLATGIERYLQWAGTKVTGGHPVWTIGENGLIFSAGGLWFVPLDASGEVQSEPVRLTTGNDGEPSLSRDGRVLAYAMSSSRTDIWKVPLNPETGLAAGPSIPVIENPSNDRVPALLSDNQRFLFKSNRADERSYAIYIADLDGSNVRLIQRGHWPGRMHLSPNERWIGTGGVSERNTLRPDGTPSGAAVAVPYLIPFDPVRGEVDGPPIEIELGFSGGLSSWDPAADRALVWSSMLGPGEIGVLSGATGSDRTVTTLPMSDNFAKAYPNVTFTRFSPDGKWIVFGAHKERHRPSIFLVRSGSDEPRLLFEGSGFPFWWSDPRRIYIASERGDDTHGKLGFLPFDPDNGLATGPFQVIDFPEFDGTVQANNCGVTADSRWLLCAVDFTEGHISVADVERVRITRVPTPENEMPEG